MTKSDFQLRGSLKTNDVATLKVAAEKTPWELKKTGYFWCMDSPLPSLTPLWSNRSHSIMNPFPNRNFPFCPIVSPHSELWFPSSTSGRLGWIVWLAKEDQLWRIKPSLIAQCIQVVFDLGKWILAPFNSEINKWMEGGGERQPPTRKKKNINE